MTGLPELRGLVPAAGARAAIGGAPAPLLRTDEGTFLDRAIRILRQAGAAQVRVLVDDPDGPVAAEARRAGGTVDPASAPGESLVALLSAAPGDAWLVLPPAFALVRASTPLALVEAARTAPPGVVLVAPDPGRPVAWNALAPVLVLGAEGVDAFERALAGGEPAADRVLRVPVDDPGTAVPVDSLTAYRRHFPGVYRRRFQKW